MTYYQTLTKLPCPNLEHVRGFLRDHGTALAEAAHRLGGPAASARVFLLCEAVRHTRRLTRAQSSQLVDFHRLLTLEHVGDPDRIESGLFAQIDPASGFVTECCLLSDKLGALLKLIAENDPTSDIRCKASHIISQVA
ncbi:hypothetical protein SAMN05421666_2084 [Roseovarius nanhaiticus]|uniref:Uncharacterized protein n=1 Tax=Roseovarius nanhaiticus TaxID=573024 RepID=A0A1N7GUD6_9RHOB|nr:hypothetical protein [Roseovarius nanhaiticus]SEL30734.1 hypothetical protein SAMN05216208_3384 [Roseovarius nanhaiticus]SIS16217.1 hypothetical protein SAMN05421666_2084 [Roseovarius nanhaiticus]